MTSTLKAFLNSPSAIAVARARTPSSRSGRVCDEVVARVLKPAAEPPDKRRWARQEYREAVLLLPVGPDGETPTGDAVTVRGSDISMAGIAFGHSRPLAGRMFVVGLRDAFGNVQRLLLTLTWTRFEDEGRYQSGGRFVRPALAVATPPLEAWHDLASA